jgi:hypothetical protein
MTDRDSQRLEQLGAEARYHANASTSIGRGFIAGAR